MKLSIIIPAHNEEHRLPPVLEAYADLFSGKMGNEVEIIVVVNGSTDGTTDIATSIAARYPQIKVIEDARRIGKGGAVILGAKAACGAWIGFVDADGATSAHEFLRLYEVGKQYDGVIASRWKRGAQVNIHQTGLRLLSSRLFNFLIRTVLGLRYVDTQCGAKIFKAEAWRTILPQVGITRYAFDVDLLYQLKRHDYRIVEEPTVWNDVAGSKVQLMNTSFEMFCAVVRMRLLYSPFHFVVKWYDRFLAKPMEFLLRDELFRHTALLFSASIITSFGNIGYQMVVGRTLPGTEYALLATFLALFAIVARPLGTLSTGINHYASLLAKEGHQGVVGRLLIKWILLTGGASVVMAGVCLLFVNQIAAFFHLERMAPVIVSAAALPAIFIAPVLGGVLQGLQRFHWTSIASISNALGRVVLGGLLVTLLYPACGWALAGHVGGMYLAVLVSLVALFPLLRNRESDGSPIPSMRFYLMQCFFIQVGAAVLMTGDVVLVKHYLPGNTDFAYAATLGRMVAFIAAAVAMAMFPKVSSAGEFTKEHRAVYLRSQLYTAGLVGASLVVCMLVPAPMLRILFKITHPSSEILAYTRGVAVVMAVSMLLNINICLLLAQRRFRLLSVTIICAVFYIMMVRLFHESGYQVILLEGIANLIALVATTIGILWQTDSGNDVKGEYETIS
ncbi:MAG: glycosyltransferase [Kiritimatiellales bacterium]|nr:glycosyltransferase [Kiritimatiellales bacterium]MCF7864027.1 glycosyltransferase [Kiritimatiellales bacterium]